MNMRVQKSSTLLSAACVFALIMTCVGNLAVGPGTGSETTNGFLAVVRYQDGSPASGAIVKVRPSDFLKGVSPALFGNTASAMVDAVTDSLGCFSIRDIELGDYVIEVIDSSESEGVLLRARATADSIVDFGVRFLDPLGRIRGTLDYSGVPDTSAVYLQIYGIDRIDQVDVSTGRFAADGMAGGAYTVRLFTPAPSFLPKVIENVVVAPRVGTVLDTVTLTPVSDWRCSRRVYLNTTASGADIAVTIKKFPVLIRLTNENFDFISARPGGADIRFVKTDNASLPHHIERWDVVAGPRGDLGEGRYRARQQQRAVFHHALGQSRCRERGQQRSGVRYRHGIRGRVAYERGGQQRRRRCVR
jgi:hypothetical protein